MSVPHTSCILAGKSYATGYGSQFSLGGSGDDIHRDFVIPSPRFICNLFHWHFHTWTWQNQARVGPQMCSEAVNWLTFPQLSACAGFP